MTGVEETTTARVGDETVRPSRWQQWLVPVAAAAALAWWIAAKVEIFQQLAYGPDLALSLELSRSFVTTGRWIYDPNFGFHTAIHNYYTIPLFAPLTLWAHEYGLFGGALALHALAVAALWRLRTIGRAGRTFLVALYLGPMGYFLFDDPVLGFHPEDVLVPLTVLFALALANGRRLAAALWAALLFLTKESGPPIIVSVWFLWRAVPEWPLDGWSRTAVRRLSVLTARAALLLGVLMAAASALLGLNQAWFGGRAAAGIRVSAHLEKLATAVYEPSFWIELAIVSGATIVISLTPLLWRRRALRFAPLLVAAILPGMAVALVSDIGYRHLPAVPLMFTAVRQVTIWGIAMAAGLFTMLRLGAAGAGERAGAGSGLADAVSGRAGTGSTRADTASERAGAGSPSRPAPLVAAVAAAFAIQTLVLALATPIPPWTRWVPWAFRDTIRRIYPLTDDERRVLRCAADAVPSGTVVGADSFASGVFGDAPVLYTTAIRPEPDPPELVVCSSRRHLLTMSCPSMLKWARERDGWQSASFDSLSFAGTPAIMSGVQACTKSAGAPGDAEASPSDR